MTDTGLATERTIMSWRRTGLSAIAVSALLLHNATTLPRGPAALATWAAMLVVVGTGVTALLVASRPEVRLRLRPVVAGAIACAGIACAVAAVLHT